ncbi:MAG: hypothetical protein KJ749_10675, partial [Planctomycetes bacterium]|nr:hypothetical protein [Planctomycetota bacterium]
EAVVRRVIADFALAQRHARLSGVDQTVNFKATLDAYALVGMPHLDHPSRDYTVDLFAEPYLADVVSVDFGGDQIITFDAYGVPDSGGSVVIQIGNSWKSISVDEVTGKASATDTDPIVVIEPEGEEGQEGEQQ